MFRNAMVAACGDLPDRAQRVRVTTWMGHGEMASVEASYEFPTPHKSIRYQPSLVLIDASISVNNASSSSGSKALGIERTFGPIDAKP